MKSKNNHIIFQKSYTLLFLMITSVMTVFAQSTYQAKEIKYNNSNEIYSIVPEPNWEQANEESLPAILKEIYSLSYTPDLILTNEEKESNFTFRNYNQAYGLATVYGSDIIVKRDNNGKILVIVGTLRNVESLGTGPYIGGDKAIEKGIEVVGLDAPFLWLYPMEEQQIRFVHDDTSATYYPRAKLMYYPRKSEPYTDFVMCYEMEIHTAEPARYFTYINASTGELEYRYNGLAHANGNGTTLYNGRKAIVTSKQNDSLYYLEDSTRKIYTRDYRSTKTRYWSFYDEDNDYTHNADKEGVSAHWAAIKTYDYYKTKFGRNSVDSKGKKVVQRVKYDSAYNNAFWNGEVMTYGSGNGVAWGPLVAVDDVGHETTHGTIEFAAGLIYQGESGALNEGWADIFGMTIEAYTGDKDWQQSEDSYTPGNGNDALRTMNNPKTNGDPDTYKGTNWKSTAIGAADDGGVHSNSGVANFWFYLLTDGKNGTNDKNEQYSVSGIGLAKSELIAYRALDKYMSTSTDYAGARIATLLATEDLYGKKSNEYKQVCNAWYAVNVGDKCCDSMEFEFKYTEPLCHDSKDGKIDLTIKKGGSDPYVFLWYKNDTLGPVLATSKDISGLEKGNYVVVVKDTAAKCEKMEKPNLKGPDELNLSISGGGILIRACDRRPEIYLQASASGGVSPYTYNWPNGKKVIASSGSVGTSGFYTGFVTDKNGCQTLRPTYAFFIPILCSYDPNDIIGPPSYGEQKWVSVNATLPYKIRFENDPKFATAPAQKVTIDHPLDSNVDLASFRLGNFGFANYLFEVPKNSSFYTKRIDLRDSLGIYLDVTAGLNLAAKKAFWVFESIDPKTGLPPANANLGFLAVNDTNTHVGEGFVDYSIKPLSSATTGDSIRALAEIVFDNNPALLTPKIHNLIDAVAPKSGIKSKPALQDSVNIHVEMFGTDDSAASGFGNWDLYLSVNKNPFTLYAQGLTDSVAVYRGDYGNEYRFYTIGSDNVLNREKSKTSPDLTVTIAPDQFIRTIDSNTSLCARDTLAIKWNKLSITSFDLEYTSNDSSFYTIATGLDPTDSIYLWVIPESISGKKNYWIRAVTGNNSIPIDSSNRFELKGIPQLDLGNDTFFCYGSSFSYTLNQGGGSYSAYRWGSGDTTRTYTATDTGTYVLKVTNAYNCFSTDNITIGHYLLPEVASINIKDVSCFNGNDGSIALVVVSGNAPYQYIWSNGDSVRDISGLAHGNYIVTITDSVECTVLDSIQINQPNILSTSPLVKQVKCNGNADAEIDLKTSGGKKPYSFVWSNSDSTEKISNLAKGTYSVVITDSNNCIHYDTFIISEPTLLTLSYSVKNVSCFGTNSGSIDLSVTGGSPNYHYRWNTGDTTQDLTKLAKGTYHVLVTDSNNCVARDTMIVTEPSKLTASTTVTHVLCNADKNGGVDLSVSGGSTPYVYLWNTTDTTQDIKGLVAGTYLVKITDAKGCILNDTATVSEPTALRISNSANNVSCNQGSNGSINVTVSGGITPYVFAWNSGDTTEDISSKSKGTYIVVVTDSNSCVIRDTANITEPSVIVSSATLQHVSCNGQNNGRITLSVSGGSPGYRYLWNNNDTTQSISGIRAGTYSVRITDTNGCVHRDTFTISEPSAIAISKQLSHVSCFDSSDGKVNLTVGGGVTPYTFVWSNSYTTEDVQGLKKGTYTVQLTDKNGCKAYDTAVVSEPTKLTSGVSVSHVLCNAGTNGSVDLSVSGGTTPYKYLWNTTDVTQDINSLGAGTFIVKVTDDNGCIINDTAIVTEPAALGISHSVLNVRCYQGSNGSVDLTVTGGVKPYAYTWSSGDTTEDINGKIKGTYTVVVKDANACILRDTSIIKEPTLISSSETLSHVSCNGLSDGSINLSVSGGSPGYRFLWSNNDTLQNITGLVAGIYSARVTDANNCVHRDTFTISEPAIIALSKKVTHITCFGFADGKVDLTVSGGTLPYNFNWSNSDTTEDVIGLDVGQIRIVLTDANGCKYLDSSTIIEPTKLQLTHSHQNLLCNKDGTGEIDLTIQGGTPIYNVKWSSGDTTLDISNLQIGTYKVDVTDANNCKANDSIVILQPDVLTSVHTQKDLLCYGYSNGSVDLTVNGGTSPYRYAWNSGDTTEDLSNKKAGTFTVDITDSNACVIKDTVHLLEPSEIILVLDSTSEIENQKNGKAWVTVTGGIGPYNYQWNDPANSTTDTAFNLSQGKYLVVVKDANGCEKTDSVEILSLLGIDGLVLKDRITIYPNPTTGFINVYGLSELGESTYLVVTDLRGLIIVEKTVSNVNSCQFEIPENTMDGTYLISLYGTSSTAHKKMILLR